MAVDIVISFSIWKPFIGKHLWSLVQTSFMKDYYFTGVLCSTTCSNAFSYNEKIRENVILHDAHGKRNQIFTRFCLTAKYYFDILRLKDGCMIKHDRTPCKLFTNINFTVLYLVAKKRRRKNKEIQNTQ